MTLGITLTEALVGFEKRIRHLDGHEVLLARSAVTRPGDVMVVEGEGMPVSSTSSSSSSSSNGRLIVHVQVQFPDTSLDAKEVNGVRQLFDVQGRVWGPVQSVVDGKEVLYSSEPDEHDPEKVESKR